MNIIICGPKWRNERIAIYLRQRGHTVMMDNERQILSDLDNGLTADLIISNGFAPIFKPHHVKKHNIINIHPASLPHGRGIYPNVWALYNGTAIGVSIHQIDEGIDTGDMLASDYMQHWELECRLNNPAETLQTFYDHLLRRAEYLFYATWPQIEDGTIVPYQQAPGGFQHYKNREQSEKLMGLFADRWATPIKIVHLAGQMAREITNAPVYGD